MHIAIDRCVAAPASTHKGARQRMHERFVAVVHGAVLAVIVGWVLYIGRPVFVPVVFSVLVVYVVVGLARLLHRIPFLRHALPPAVRYGLSVAVIAVALTAAVYEIVSWMDVLLERAPGYQEAMLGAIQRAAVYFHFESEPTWATLRRDFLARIDVQTILTSTVSAAFSLTASVVFVFLCATFLLLERGSFDAKLAQMTPDPGGAARVRGVIADVNGRIGSYLALKTFLSILLGAVSWAIMAYLGLQFAAFWAVLIALLNYIPYLGSILGVLLPVAAAILQFGTMDEIVVLLLLLGTAQFLIGNFLDPYVMSNSLNLSPFAILVSLTVWSALWGLAGAFLAVPVTAIVAIVLSEFEGTRPIAVLLSRDGRL
jgi:predicted PurR-regulated permease PerM